LVAENKLEGALGLAVVVVAVTAFAGFDFFRFFFLELVVLAELGVLFDADFVDSLFC
jgi:hypothetical protein